MYICTFSDSISLSPHSREGSFTDSIACWHYKDYPNQGAYFTKIVFAAEERLRKQLAKALLQ